MSNGEQGSASYYQMVAERDEARALLEHVTQERSEISLQLSELQAKYTQLLADLTGLVQLVWEQDSNSWCGLLKKVRCFKIFWNPYLRKGSDLPPYVLVTMLPGLKANVGNFETVEDAKEKAVLELTRWLRMSGLSNINCNKGDQLEPNK